MVMEIQSGQIENGLTITVVWSQNNAPLVLGGASLSLHCLFLNEYITRKWVFGRIPSLGQCPIFSQNGVELQCYLFHFNAVKHTRLSVDYVIMLILVYQLTGAPLNVRFIFQHIDHGIAWARSNLNSTPIVQTGFLTPVVITPEMSLALMRTSEKHLHFSCTFHDHSSVHGVLYQGV